MISSYRVISYRSNARIDNEGDSRSLELNDGCNGTML